MSCPLDGIRVLDLSRVLAGPWASQTLADLGAEVIKVERPGTGDDTRSWGPPYATDARGKSTSDSAYFLSTNRGKKSVTIDIADQQGQNAIRELARRSDVLIENFKVGGLASGRLGNAHPNIVPYQTFATSDGHFILAVGNDSQFRRFCETAGCPELADNELFANNSARVANRETLVPLIEARTRRRPTSRWIADLEAAGVPPINDLEAVFADEQVIHRGLRLDLPHAVGGTVPSVACPIHFLHAKTHTRGARQFGWLGRLISWSLSPAASAGGASVCFGIT